ncbi:Uncharacterised protein [Streptococcus pneumoniae]|nr:Uncharacterised protein [Streptococcus pneumoniae]
MPTIWVSCLPKPTSTLDFLKNHCSGLSVTIILPTFSERSEPSYWTTGNLTFSARSNIPTLSKSEYSSFSHTSKRAYSLCSPCPSSKLPVSTSSTRNSFDFTWVKLNSNSCFSVKFSVAVIIISSLKYF